NRASAQALGIPHYGLTMAQGRSLDRVICRMLVCMLPAILPLSLVVSAESPRSQWDGVYTEEQATRGQTPYMENCFMCHGRDLSGTILGPPLAGPAFGTRWNGKTLDGILRIVQTSMPLNFQTHFSQQQNTDIIAFMLMKGGAPPGLRELPVQRDALKAIT